MVERRFGGLVEKDGVAAVCVWESPGGFWLVAVGVPGMRVLVGIGGAVDDRGIVRTVEQASSLGDEVMVAVVEHPTADIDPGVVSDRVERAVEEVSGCMEVRTASGDGGSRLVEIAETEGFDAIVIDGGARTPTGKVALGPLTEFVVLNATVTVMLVR